MRLASWAVNRQLIVAPAAFRSDTQALTALSRLSWSTLRPRRQARASTLNSISAIFSQLPCLGVWWNSSRLAMRRASGAGEGLVKRGQAMGVQVVQNQPNHRDIGICVIHQPAHLVGKVLHGATLCYRHVAPAPAGLASQEQVARARPLVFVVLTPRPPGLCWQRFPDVGQHWVQVSSKQTTGLCGS